MKHEITQEEIEKLSFEFAEMKKFAVSLPHRDLARLLRQYTIFLMKKHTIQNK